MSQVFPILSDVEARAEHLGVSKAAAFLHLVLHEAFMNVEMDLSECYFTSDELRRHLDWQWSTLHDALDELEGVGAIGATTLDGNTVAWHYMNCDAIEIGGAA